MAKILETICEKLKDIRTYLIKIGPSRRHGTILKKKLEEAKLVLTEYVASLKI